MTISGTKSAVGDALTDGSGISKLTGSKVLKDLVADILLGASAGVVAVHVGGLQDAVVAPTVAGFAIANAVIAGLYRTVLRWATS